MRTMIKILLLGLTILISILTSQPVLAESSQTNDPRSKILQAYFAKYKSPLVDEAPNFIEAADKYDLDWKLVPSITGVESTFGKHIPGGSDPKYTSYNGWGWGVYGTQAIYFKSWREGIFTVSEGLRQNYLNKGLVNPYEINRIYAASPSWGAHVSYFLNDLDRFDQEYRAEHSELAQLLVINYNVANSSYSRITTTALTY